ncbi:MAG: acetolactate synthase, large subunit, biosynthetic type [Elusimicrobia bacterium RIFCSPLOWO2_02_FULL_39_32]|nr:MAG: acetolactate synthase, large subunit, biosynthetic type [Elusimicrobia bacterium RIFCSPHIGHO2_02_FULL_39_36]OGR92624.1 MAG: acetolactate synthase, large subunit, biosynthetic type [Elusimicrobia bacterium RIFCSPLOWO2_02_FULL_39_32]OGR99270.1 MAG: acetolactate synthase, large subunit, biosynthetic type [Elusimicrobia bacterium RIFCSPLOWO2_12_FULL_39_28]
MEKTGAEIIVECLEREGVEFIFGIPGGCNLPFFDKLYDSKIRLILTRHEQGASHMADGYARSTGKVGVCTATSGPGATNLVTGLATAHMDSIPLVAITGQVRTDVIGSDAFQEADAIGCTRPVTKHNYLVKDVKDLAHVIREAFYIASTGRPGPVHIDVPVDIQRAKIEFSYPEKISIRSYSPTIKGHPLQIKKALELIKAAERPLLYVGGGTILSGATKELRTLAEKANIPVATTLMANGAMPFDHPLYLGPLGMHGKYSTNTAMQKCDLMISCGARFDDRVTGKLSSFSPHSKKIHFDIDPANIGKSVAVDVPVVGDLKTVLKELNDQMPEKNHKPWIEQIKEWDKKHPFSYKEDQGKDPFIKPQYVIQELHRLTKGEAIITTGVGQHQMWAMQWYPCKYPRHFLTSGGLGTMGYGFPSSIGAKLAFPEKPVICIDGDGSFQMTMSEMATAIHENVKVIVIILNNYYLGMVRQWQELFYKERFSASCLTAQGGRRTKENEPDPRSLKYIPDFVKFAEAYGALGLRLTHKEEVEGALKQALDSKVPVILDVIIHPEEKVFPMVPAGAGLDDIIVDMA